jgi:hypothetical protein
VARGLPLAAFGTTMILLNAFIVAVTWGTQRPSYQWQAFQMVVGLVALLWGLALLVRRSR